MARPRLDEAERRERTVGVRVTAAEAAELRELNRIGVNLNQMARALNSRAVSSPAETQEGHVRQPEDYFDMFDMEDP